MEDEAEMDKFLAEYEATLSPAHSFSSSSSAAAAAAASVAVPAVVEPPLTPYASAALEAATALAAAATDLLATSSTTPLVPSADSFVLSIGDKVMLMLRCTSVDATFVFRPAPRKGSSNAAWQQLNVTASGISVAAAHGHLGYSNFKGAKLSVLAAIGQNVVVGTVVAVKSPRWLVIADGEVWEVVAVFVSGAKRSM